jgi:acyl-coenzyme A synthetase/AMP-(fatty) acid ligase
VPLYGEGLGLDSIDILEIALVVSKRHGVQLKVENAENRQVFISLRALLDAQLPLPEIALVVCATAPWSSELAQEGETRCNTRLMEIYGSTETGQVASRHTTRTPVWDLFPGVRFSGSGDGSDGARVSGGHVETPVVMSDLIEPVGDIQFLLHGRLADMINIAGKRHSLASLNHLLNGIPGVTDGVFYMPDSPPNGHVPRLVACVVAPDLDASRLLAARREHLDRVFLPRPLLFVDALPRNNTGKLPRQALQALFKSL